MPRIKKAVPLRILLLLIPPDFIRGSRD